MKELFYIMSSGLLSSLITLLITFYVSNKRELISQKIKLIEEVVGNRYALATQKETESLEKLLSALNKVFVIFNDDELIINQIDKLRISINGGEFDKEFAKLIKMMCKNAGLKIPKSIDDDFFTKAITKK